MEEKTLIKSERKAFGAAPYVFIGIVSVLAGGIEHIIHYNSLGGFSGEGLWVSIGAFVLLLLILIAIRAMLNKCELTVTDKRIFGHGIGGKRVDIPLDSVSAIGSGLFSSISVTSASGAIKFALIKNRDEIQKVLSDLLIERQSKPKAETTIKQEIPQSNADELKKFKELLDNGIITQEEFDAKKKQLLGL